jgi:hypothetical protein
MNIKLKKVHNLMIILCYLVLTKNYTILKIVLVNLNITVCNLTKARAYLKSLATSSREGYMRSGLYSSG